MYRYINIDTTDRWRLIKEDIKPIYIQTPKDVLKIKFSVVNMFKPEQ